MSGLKLYSRILYEVLFKQFHRRWWAKVFNPMIRLHQNQHQRASELHP